MPMTNAPRLPNLPRWLVWSGLVATVLALSWLRFGTSGAHGQARVIDGDSLVVNGREVRLKGIDAPEGRQTCRRNDATWACGEEARRHLTGLISNRQVRCGGAESDQHGRLLGTCEVAGRSLNAAMVEDGYAVSYGGTYQREEARARGERRGLWSGEFERPRDWRDTHPRR